MLNKWFKMDRRPPSLSAWKPDLPISLAGKTFWSRRGHYVARVVFPILGDSLANSRRWLSSHRRSLHSHGDHLQRATSSVLSDRGDESRGGLEDGKLTDFNSIRLVRQQTSGDCLLLHTAGGSLRLNLGKIGPLIQAVHEVTSAAVGFSPTL